MKKTTYDLICEIVKMGFDWDSTFEQIDSFLDVLFCRNRKPIKEEYIPDELFDAMLNETKYWKRNE